MIATILLLPNADTRERVLAPHAPSCRRLTSGAASWGTLVGELGDVRHYVPFAGSCPIDRYVHLPLARDGAVVPEGVDRLVATEVAAVLGQEHTSEELLALERLRGLVSTLGTLVVFDSDGRKVSL